MNRRLYIMGVIFLCLWAGPAGPASGACRGEDRGALPEIRRLDRKLSGAKGVELVQLLIRRGDAWQDTGHYDAAESDFNRARTLANELGRRELSILSEHFLGFLAFLRGDLKTAERMLGHALGLSRSMDLPGLSAACAHRLGTVLAGMGRKEEGFLFYREALALAKKTGDPGMEAHILVNLARILPQTAQALDNLALALNLAGRIHSLKERTDLFLGIGTEALNRKTEQGYHLAFDTLTAALAQGEDHGWVRRQSQALGGLGRLYENLGEYREALGATGRALEKAQSIRAHDLMMVWEWQRGRVLRAAGKEKGALAAFRRAVFHSQILQKDIRNGSASFHGVLFPLHRDLADLLLVQAATASGEAQRRALLREARAAVEGTKVSEIRDYFRDPCLGALGREVETLSPDTAVLYPILLPDRVELLVDVRGQLFCRPSPIPGDELARQALDFAHCLRKGRKFRGLARTLYDALIRPVAPILEKYGIKTLVHVPDGALRLIPLAALMDENQFLVEAYALVTVPGLTLLDPAPLGKYGNKTLLAGISEPGPVIHDLPKKLWQRLGSLGGGPGPGAGIRGLSLEAAASTAFDGPGRPAGEGEFERVRQALALPGVKEEIRKLSGHLDSKVLFNREFLLESFSSALGKESYAIVHIASHGFFGGTPEQNFIMTFDRRLDMKGLETIIRPKQLADRPVELITLSACQTAEGNDKSPLGLTGVVLKSGARSALGSLWPVSDQASQILFPEFYTRLACSGGASSKAEALQRAQLSLMAREPFRHPFFWAPFILVGNWL